MAVRDPANATNLLTEMVDVEVVRVTIKISIPRPAAAFSTMSFPARSSSHPAKVKTSEISAPVRDQILEQRDRGGMWEIMPAGSKQ